MSSLITLNGGTFDTTDNKLNINSSNIILVQNYGISGGLTDISRNMFTITNSSINVENTNTTLGLNNTWTGKNIFKGDISFINTNTIIDASNAINLRGGTISLGSSNILLPNIQAQKKNNVVFFDTATSALSYGTATSFSDDVSFNNANTQINSTSVIGLSGGAVNISGGTVRLGSTNIVFPNIPQQKKNNVVFFDTTTSALSYGTATSFSDDVSFNNANTQINSTSVIGLSGGTISLGSSNIILPNITQQKKNNVVFFDTATSALSYGTATSFSDDVSFNNANTQINSTSVIGLSGGVVNIGGGALNIASSTVVSGAAALIGATSINKATVLNGTTIISGMSNITGNSTFNNTKTQINSTSLIGLSGGTIRIGSSNVVLPNIPKQPKQNFVYFDTSTNALSYGSANNFTNDTATQVNSTTVIGLSGGIINISGDVVNISGGPVNIGKANLSSLDVSGNASIIGNASISGNATFNNATTQINSSSVIGLSGGVVNISGGIVNICGGTVNISGGTMNVDSITRLNGTTILKGPSQLNGLTTTASININGSAAFGNSLTGNGWSIDSAGNTTFNNATTQISSTSVLGLSGGIINISGGTVNIGGGNTIINGNVGIGTTQPNSPLDVINKSTSQYPIISQFFSPNASGGLEQGPRIRIGVNETNSISMTYNKVGDLSSNNWIGLGHTNVADGQFVLTRAGNVGIGTTSPSEKLDVNGIIRAKNPGNNGAVSMVAGTYLHPGYIAFNKPNGTRVGYIGWQDTTANYFQLMTEDTYLGYKVNKNLLVDGDLGIGTQSPGYKLDVGGVIKGTSLLIGTSTDTTSLRAISCLKSDMAINTPTYITLGQSNTTNNQAEIMFKYKGDGLDTNEMALGLHSHTLMTLIGNGKVGIGTTTPEYKLDVNGNAHIQNELYVGQSNSGSTIYMGGGAIGDGAYNHSVIETRNYANTESTELLLFKGNDIPGSDTPVGPDRIRLRASQIVFDTYSSGTVDRNAENIRMTINESGNVGIGTTIPGARLEVLGSDRQSSLLIKGTQPGILLNNTTAGGKNWNMWSTGAGETTGAGNLAFYDGTDYRMIINNSGNVGIGTTSPLSLLSIGGDAGGNGVIQVVSTPGKNQDGACFKACVDTNYIIDFRNKIGGHRGWIGGTETTVTYNSVSDRRLKTNIIDMRSTKNRIKQIKTREFDWKSSNNHTYGFIAQEIFELFPEMRQINSGYSNCKCNVNDLLNGILCDAENYNHDEPVDNDGKPLYYGLDYSMFVPYLVKAYQESDKELEDTKNDFKTKIELQQASQTQMQASQTQIQQEQQADKAKIQELENKVAMLEQQMAAIIAKLGMNYTFE